MRINKILVVEFIKTNVYIINNYFLAKQCQEIEIPEYLVEYSDYIKNEIESKTNVKIKTKSILFF